jgi:hypothetical protein
VVVDRNARQDLAACLERLVAGEFSNEEFDARYRAAWSASGDPGVVEIATFGWGLYSSDLPLPYKLRGRHRPDDEVRRAAERAVLFLHSGREYPWPRASTGVMPYWCLWGPGCYLVFGLVVAFVGAVSMLLGTVAWERLQGVAVTALGAVVVMVPSHRWHANRRQAAEEKARFGQAGDVTAWPFLRQVDWEEARVQAGTIRF